MTKTKTSTAPTKPDEEPEIEGTPSERDDARLRSERCHREILGVLERYHCRIVPVLTPEQVGGGPLTRMLIGATYGVLPDPVT